MAARDASMARWPLTSRYYDPLTMNASLLANLNDDLVLDGYYIRHLDLGDGQICK